MNAAPLTRLELDQLVSRSIISETEVELTLVITRTVLRVPIEDWTKNRMTTAQITLLKAERALWERTNEWNVA